MIVLTSMKSMIYTKITVVHSGILYFFHFSTRGIIRKATNPAMTRREIMLLERYNIYPSARIPIRMTIFFVQLRSSLFIKK